MAEKAGANTKSLETALNHSMQKCRAVIDRLRESHSALTETEVEEAVVVLREVAEICACARRLVRGRTMGEIHDAFGAPGDFGYDTPLGDALAGIYRGGGA